MSCKHTERVVSVGFFLQTACHKEDILEALVYYKHPSFDSSIPLRISFKGQPAIDTGGITRQFFSDV